MTLYRPLTNAVAPVPEPSQSLSQLKLSGFSYPSRTWTPLNPARHSRPETEINTRTMSLNNPSAFWRRTPHLSRVPWTRQINDKQKKATKRVWNQVGSMDNELRRSAEIGTYVGEATVIGDHCIHSLKTTLFAVAVPWMCQINKGERMWEE